MVLNYIWIAFFLIAFVFGIISLLTGDTTIFQKMVDATFDSSKTAFETSLGLTGVLALWLGIMKIGEKAGVVNVLARILSPLFTKLFLVLNTSGLTIIPTTILAFRSADGAAQPTDVFIPILLATTVATLAGIIITAGWQRINIFQPALLAALVGLTAFVGLVIWGFGQMDKQTMGTVTSVASNLILMSIIVLFIGAGLLRRVNVYDAFIEGAKEGFSTAVRIIPYLVAILVAVGVFRASGAMDLLIKGIQWCVGQCGLNTDFVGALPTAFMKPLSGSGARGLMLEAMKSYGPDSFVGRLSCIFQGSTDTTFYVLAVYFGSISVKYTRHAVACGLLADLAGVIAAIAVCYVFF